jgi:hypothetical protein
MNTGCSDKGKETPAFRLGSISNPSLQQRSLDRLLLWRRKHHPWDSQIK